MTLWVRMLPILMAVAMGRESWAQTQYQQAQFSGANVNFNFQDVSWLTVAPGDNIYMLQRAGADVSIWSSAGQVLHRWWMDELQFPHSLRTHTDADGEHIWVTDMVPPGIQAGPGVVPHGHCVKEFSESGKRLGTIGICGEGGAGLNPVQFDKVTDIAFNSQGLRWISDGDLGGLNNRVLQLDRNGNVLQVWSAPGNQPGSGPREFNLPHALDIDSCDRVFVADTLNHRIQVIRTDGTVLQQLQCFGTDGVYGLRLTKPNASGRLRLATTSSPDPKPDGRDGSALQCRAELHGAKAGAGRLHDRRAVGHRAAAVPDDRHAAFRRCRFNRRHLHRHARRQLATAEMGAGATARNDNRAALIAARNGYAQQKPCL